MTKPLVTYPDVERLVVDWLDDEFAEQLIDVAVGIPVPTTWTPGSDPFVQVAVDDVDTADHPVAATATVRITVWADATTEAKRLAGLAHGFLLTNRDAGCRPITGPTATQDPDTRAQLASFTVALRVRSQTVHNS